MASWVTGLLTSTGYAGLIFLMFLENVFPPIPSELIVPLAGYMTRKGELTFVGIVIAGALGSLLGALLLYYVGRKLGLDRTKELARRRGRWLTISERDVERAKHWFDRHGTSAVFFCRLVPGIRSLISVPAGIGSMRMSTFVFLTTAGAAIWTAVLATVGYVLAQNFRKVEQYLDPVSWVIFGGIVVLYLARVFRRV
jgi:membrane protein DedA with SNARE-associated domain